MEVGVEALILDVFNKPHADAYPSGLLPTGLLPVTTREHHRYQIRNCIDHSSCLEQSSSPHCRIQGLDPREGRSSWGRWAIIRETADREWYRWISDTLQQFWLRACIMTYSDLITFKYRAGKKKATVFIYRSQDSLVRYFNHNAPAGSHNETRRPKQDPSAREKHLQHQATPEGQNIRTTGAQNSGKALVRVHRLVQSNVPKESV